MSDPEGLDWLADDEGNLRPEVAEALETGARPRPAAPPEIPPEVRTLGRWTLRALVVVGAVWCVVSFIEWVLLLCFILGLCVRLSRWSETQRGAGRGAAGAERRARTGARRPAEEIPLHGTGPAAPQDADPVLAMEE